MCSTTMAAMYQPGLQVTESPGRVDPLTSNVELADLVHPGGQVKGPLWPVGAKASP
jgi:hypothetical protein